MKTETTSGGMGKLILRLILSILLVFSLLGTVGCAVGISVLHSPSQLIAQMHKQNAGQKVYDSLQTRFTTDYNTTAVPANVYMDAISVDWLEQCVEQKLTALYGADSDLLDFSALESSITDYFEKYAEENHDVLVRFAKALYKGFDYRADHSHDDEVCGWIADKIKLDKQTLLEQVNVADWTTSEFIRDHMDDVKGYYELQQKSFVESGDCEETPVDNYVLFDVMEEACAE